MESIDKIIAILSRKGHSNLARLLKGSSYSLNISSTYGTRLFSTLTTAEIYSSLEQNEKLNQLNDSDINKIIEAFRVVYPVKANSIEISHIEFFVNPDLPIISGLAEISALKTVDYDYIREQIQKCDEKLNFGDFEGAITNARNLLETICKYILDNLDIEYKSKDELNSLYKKVSTQLNMDPSRYEEAYFKEILSGCFSIVNGLANVRNVLSDAHGKSKKSHYRPSQRHAFFTVGIAKSLSEFLYASYLDKKKVNKQSPSYLTQNSILRSTIH